MPTRLRILLYDIRSSFWFIPGLMLLGALMLSWAAATIDLNLNLQIDREAKSWNVWIGPSGARTLLNTIAGSMITVTSLVFSMTIVALTMAASNLGPRVIVYFVRDRVTQISLGLFLATFVYAMMAILVVRDHDDSPFVPYVALAVAVFLAIVCFGWLIFFIHRIAHEIQADTVVAKIAAELSDAITEVLQDVEEDEDPDKTEAAEQSFPDKANGISAEQSGYIQFITHDEILECAVELDMLVELRFRAGHFVVSGEQLAGIAGRDGNALDSSDREKAVAIIRDAVVIGTKRTLGQDIEFAVRHLVEVGVRALSPGINDFNTAVATLDRLSGALAEAFQRGLPRARLRDDDGTVRIWTSPITFQGLVESAFNEIRQCAAGNVAVTIRLLEALRRLARVARTEAQFKALRRQAESLMAGARNAISDGPDLEDLEERYEAFNEVAAQ